MPSRIINFGSVNLDYVYSVPHFSRAGETLASTAFTKHAGGKGLNQSIALARAGASVTHVGAAGADGSLLVETLAAEGVDLSYFLTVDEATGHAIIQTSPAGENSILLYGGANQQIPEALIEKALRELPQDSIVLTQNETNLTFEVLKIAADHGFRVAWNPAPATDACRNVALDCLSYLVLNEVEGGDLTGESEPEQILDCLAQQAPRTTIVLTLGAQGSIVAANGEVFNVPAAKVNQVVDTTAAGDTFIGYFLAAIAAGLTLETAVNRATIASAKCVERAGASSSIPLVAELFS